ncbi:MAG: hypothetical protein QF440_05510 [Candidatus Thalassarchaeaceae archaeon]|jgi:hypothetical protein|nr:hypothetical protein [Candidatus Thalassarchaeaceae archaeon]
MEEREIERMAEIDSMNRFEDQSGRESADGMLILADALTYAAGVAAVITAIVNSKEAGWSFDVHAKILIGAGFGLWLCSQSLNNFRRLLPVWLRIVLGMKILPETFEEQSLGARKRRMWTMVIAAILTIIIAIEFTNSQVVSTRSGVPFHIVLWIISLMDLAVALQWKKVIANANKIQRRPGGWKY